MASVKWLWLGDDKAWNDYGAKLSEKIEEAYNNSKSKIRVDTQRFIDLKDMVQRRYDLSGKDRLVKRQQDKKPTAVADDSSPLLSGLIFFLLGSFSSSYSKEKITNDIDAAGGLVAWGFHRKVTHVVCNPKESSTILHQLSFIAKEAAKNKVPVLSDDFVSSSLTKNALQNVSDFTVSLLKKKEKKASDDEGEEPKTGGTKRKPSSKVEPPAKKSRANDEDDEEDNQDEVDADYILGKLKDSKNEIEGVLFQGHPFEMAVGVKGKEKNKFEGTMEWPTLDNTITKFRGKLESATELSINEFEAIEGDGVEVPNNYAGKLSVSGSTTKVVGLATDPHGEKSKFEINFP